MIGADRKLHYDVVVVGAGSTGATLAARLSENPGRQVLLLEGGAVYRTLDEMPSSVRDPADLSNVLPGAAHNWDYFGRITEAVQRPIARGRGMGGSGAINGAYFIRGTERNFERWAQAGHSLWSYAQVLPFYKKLESDLDFSGELHGTSGPITVTRETSDRSPEFTPAFSDACLELGFPSEADKNSGGNGGIGPVPMNIHRGLRISAAVGYLLPAVDRPNLHIVGGTRVVGLLFEGSRCVGVEALVGNKRVTYRADEIVLSAGAFRSPQLLMLSGIGPAAHLRDHGVEVRVDLPGVGQNLTDHPELSVSWSYRGRYPEMPGRGTLTAVLNWTSENSPDDGDLEILPFVCTRGQMIRAHGMARRPLESLRMVRRTSVRFVVDEARAMRLPFAVIGLMQPEGRGSVTLSSGDPTSNPVIRWDIFSEERDRRRFREAIRVTAELFETKPLTSIGGRLEDLDTRTARDAKTLDSWMQTHVFTCGHASSTCKMGVESDPTAVVDQRGRVYGVEALRVADQSIFPMIPSRGPNATAIMVGERMAALFEERSAPLTKAAKSARD